MHKPKGTQYSKKYGTVVGAVCFYLTFLKLEMPLIVYTPVLKKVKPLTLTNTAHTKGYRGF